MIKDNKAILNNLIGLMIKSIITLLLILKQIYIIKKFEIVFLLDIKCFTIKSIHKNNN